MRVHAILPAKEKFTKSQAGAVAMVLHDFTTGSVYQAQTLIVGTSISEAPLGQIAYKSIESWHRYFYGRNFGLAHGYIRWVKSLSRTAQPELIEVHGRCAVAGIIAQALPHIPVMLVLHNDPREMDGARTIAERTRLAQRLAGISAVSAYLVECFKDGLTEAAGQCPFYVTRFGMDRLYHQPPAKQKMIVLVGRMVPEKGILEAAQALADVLPAYPEWQFKLIGARRFTAGDMSPYEKQVNSILSPLGAQAEMLGHMSIEDVRKYQAEAAIILAPSQWQEPAGRVILEALSTGAALITSEKGGIPEYAGDHSILLKVPNSEMIASSLRALLSDKSALENWQDRAWKSQFLTLQAAAEIMDSARSDTVRYFANR